MSYQSRWALAAYAGIAVVVYRVTWEATDWDLPSVARAERRVHELATPPPGTDECINKIQLGLE